MRYKYKIEILYINPETSESKEIYVQNIKSLAIDRNYESCNMPVALLTLTLDKNLIDDMILNVNKNRLNISLFKYSLDGDQALEKVFSEQFTYSTDRDINYHKDIDYVDSETEFNNGKPREDIFDTIKLGIMCKKNLDNKAHYVNKIVHNCTVEECLVQELQGMDIIMEPFESSTKRDTIIITPTETYQKLLEKLNKIDGFYSTPFRFFMDYDIAYLLSSSGNATKAKTETYSAVTFDIRNIADSSKDPYYPGFDIDADNNCYTIPIPTDNTEYKMNHITSKFQNDIKAIIDVSKEVKSKNASAKNLIKKLSAQKNKITKVVNDNISKIASVGTDLNKIGRGIENDIKVANKVNKKLESVLEVINTGMGPYGKHAITLGDFTSINQALSDIGTVRNNMTSLSSLVNLLPSEFSEMKDKLFSTAHKSMNFSSFLDCVSEINFNDNINGAQDLCTTIISSATENVQRVNESNYNKTAELYDKLNNKVGNIVDIINKLPTTFQMKSDGSGGYVDPSPDDPPETEYITVDLSEAKANAIELITTSDETMGGNIQTVLADCSTEFNENVISMINTQNTSKAIANGCSGSIANVMNTKNTLGDEFNGGAIQLYDNSVEKISNIKSNMANAITLNSNSVINYGNNILDQVKNSISELGNLNDIGSLGLSELDTAISIDGKELLRDETTKTTAMRIPNDNVNLLKQEAAKIKLTASVLTLNKYDLDTQVFTPNKSYTIKNYDTHSDRDGKFILSMKKEIYMREDDSFRLTTVLTFRKAE